MCSIKRDRNENKHTRLWVTGHTMAVFIFFSIVSFKYIEWTNVNWTTATHMHARSPNAYLHRSGSLLRWVIGPHIGFKSSQVIKRPHNSGGVECVHAVETKVKPAWRTSILRSAFLCATQIWRKKRGHVVMGDRSQPSRFLPPAEGFSF